MITKKHVLAAACLFLPFFLSLFPVFAARDYVLGEGDVLKITVYGHEDLTTLERISGEGAINFPLIGRVKVSGLTVPDVSRKLAGLLADGYLVSPQVSIFIEEFRSKKTVIMGEVRKPGLYELKGNTSFLELVSMAGGLTENAGDTAIIKRKTRSEEESVRTVDLQRLLEEGDQSFNIMMLDGDSVFVPTAGLFYVTGEVRKPDAYKHKEGTTVIHAITMAGGLTDKAAAGRIRIIRKENGKERVISRVKMDEPVYPDDVIVIPESFF